MEVNMGNKKYTHLFDLSDYFIFEAVQANKFFCGLSVTILDFLDQQKKFTTSATIKCY